MKFLKFLVGIALLLVVIFFLGGFLLPDRMALERQVDIDRPAALVFAVANDLSRFNDWSPWYPLDPDATYRYEGPASGPGATVHWQGNESVGSGTMRIVANDAPTQVSTQLVFDGFETPANGGYLIEATSGTTSRMTWTFDSDLKGATARWFGLLMPRYIGADYEKGLANFKALLEAMPADDFGDIDVAEQDVPAIDVISVAGSAPAGDMEATAAVLGELYGQLMAFAGERGIEISGQPLTLTDELDGDVWRFRAALPVRDGASIQVAAPVGVERLAAGRALVVEHVGPYSGLAAALDKLDAYARAYGHRRSGSIRQVYVSDPGDTPPEALLTRIVFPITVD